MAKGSLDKIKIYYDPVGNTLNVWFDDPKKEVISEETGEETIISKDKDGNIIGFEKLNFVLPKGKKLDSLPIEKIKV